MAEDQPSGSPSTATIMSGRNSVPRQGLKIARGIGRAWQPHPCFIDGFCRRPLTPQASLLQGLSGPANGVCREAIFFETAWRV